MEEIVGPGMLENVVGVFVLLGASVLIVQFLVIDLKLLHSRHMGRAPL